MTTDLTLNGALNIPLAGVKLNGIDITEDSISIRLNTEMGTVIGVCDADCCSETWIENIELPALGLPCTIVKAEQLEMPEGREAIEGEPQDYIQFYGVKFITDKGEIVIEYRNASNGYYGGDLDWDGKHFYGGVYGQNTPNQDDWLPVDEWLSRKTLKLNQE